MKRLIFINAVCLTMVLAALPFLAFASDSSEEGEGDPKNAYNIMMNYELGMHCTGFEFSYCCILPPYNSILAQVVKTEKVGAKPKLLQADHKLGVDALGRPTVVRDTELDADGNFKKYVLRYWHDAQPRNDGRGAPQTSTLISRVEGNSLMMWNTVFDSAAVDQDGRLIYDENGVLQGDGDFNDPTDNYANAWLNHFYIYEDLEGSNPTNSSLESDKIRLGVQGHVEYPASVGAALHPMGPGVKGAGFDNVLTFSGETGTVVFTQMKVLENLPVMLTAPRIWEALGLPLTPFEDSINFFGDPGAVDEETIRPYVKMQAQLEDYASHRPILDNGQPVQGFGTAPIDIPNCERCHAIGPGSVNSAQGEDPMDNPMISRMVQDEIEFWQAYYSIDPAAGDSDWYPRIKGAAISILALHDAQHGTSFTANYPHTPPPGDTDSPQRTRLGGPSVLCQRCHADNVIAVVKSAHNPATGQLIPPLSEAIHYNHKDNEFSDDLGRNGSCQGCHPAHRSDGDMADYPIDEMGENTFANRDDNVLGDNRDAAGGCYVGRDVHSNPGKDADGVETPSHLNAVGDWLVDNVVRDTGTWKGIWCTNCHTQLSQELWKHDDLDDAINGIGTTARDNPSLAAVAQELGISEAQAIAWLDPKNNDDSMAIWDPKLVVRPNNPEDPLDAFVATIEVDPNGNPVGTTDGDGDFSVNVLSFCTTPSCLDDINTNKQDYRYIDPVRNRGVAVPFSAATDGRDHWLAAGEPHCADCHTPPYVENSGSNNPYPPFNYPKKHALFRYSRGHQDLSCQACHESIHGLYPVTPDIDTTTYAQAASMNSDGSHGPLKCGACHIVRSNGVIAEFERLSYQGTPIRRNYDAAVSWAHTYTEEADPRDSICLGCHEDERDEVSSTEEEWTEHAQEGRVSRRAMDKVEILQLAHVAGDPDFEDPFRTVCLSCHGDEQNEVACGEREWLEHLDRGRVAESVWEYVSTTMTGDTCGY